MKKIISLFLTLCLVASLAACGGNSAADAPEAPALEGAAPLAAAAQSNSSPFTDVPSDASYAQAVEWCRENGIMSGTSATTFNPNGTLTRAMLATVLHRAAGAPEAAETTTFTDNASGTYYHEAIVWAASKGIIAGYGDGRFGSGDPVRREQLATILWRYDGEKAAETVNFPDASFISNYARTAVNWAASRGVMASRTGGGFAPLEAATRAEAAMALYAYLSDQASTPATGNTPAEPNGKPVVYMTTNISSDGLMAIYKALEASPEGNIAVKLSTGEPGSNYLRTDLIGELVQSLNASIVECNTAYGGSRSNTAMHRQVAEDHGYTAIATVDIMDAEGEAALPVIGGDNLKENYVGSHFENYDYFVVLSHFKGHAMAGYGGAIKNISIGIASSHGKSWIHSGGTGGSMWGGDQDAFLESMAEAGKSVVEALDGNILYINVMNRLSVDCDCDGSPAAPDMHDIGILASYDPVALDQACVDLVYAADDGNSLVRRIESRNGIHTLEQAEKIGLGSREYQLVSIDEGGQNTVNNQINVTFNSHTYTATLVDNTSAEAFADYLRQNGGSVTVSAHDYGSFEKVGPLGTSLITNNEQINTVPGDIILYQGNSICLYYATNSWNFTRLGKLDGDLSSLRADLGDGDVNIIYSIP